MPISNRKESTEDGGAVDTVHNNINELMKLLTPDFLSGSTWKWL